MPPRRPPHLDLSLTPRDVGQRVTVRRELPTGHHSDVIGELEFWEAGLLGLRRRDGSLVEVAEDTLVAGKVVPPPPPRRRPRAG